MTLANALVDGLRHAGVGRLFVVRDEGSLTPLVAAARRVGLPVADAPDAHTACLMAAVTAEITEAPGGAAIPAAAAEANTAIRYAAAARARIVVIAVGPGVAGAAAPSAEPPGRALARALTPPGGPALLAVGSDELVRSTASLTIEPPRSEPPDERALDRAAELLDAATRPVIVAGVEARSRAVAAWLRPFAESLPAPVLATSRARGVLADPHPLALGSAGGAGAPTTLLARTDLIVSLGVDPSELGGAWAPHVPVLHVGPTPPAPALRASAAVVGDIALVLEELAPRLRGRVHADWDVAELDRLKRVGRARAPGFSVREVAEVARQAMPSGTIAIIDGGACAAELAAGWQAVAPGELLLAPEPAPRDFGPAAAIAAQLARPDARVLCFASSGVGPEALAAIGRRGLPVLMLRVGAASASAAPAGVTVLAAAGRQALAGALGRALGARGAVLVDVAPV